MFISSFRSSPSITPQTTNLAAKGTKAFSEILAGTAQIDSPIVQISAAAQRASDTLTSSSNENPSFTSMTPRQFSTSAQALYDKGAIGLDGLFKMQMAAGGIFKDTPATAGESQAPVDYVAYFQTQLDGIASRGGVNDPRSGYQDVANILTLLAR